MRKRPLSIHIISFAYFFAPAIYAFRIAWVNQWPFTGVRSVFNHFSALEWSILAFFPIVANGISRAAPWGYYLFVVLSFSLIGQDIYMYFHNPSYTVYISLLFHAVAMSGVGLILHKHTFNAYFNPKLLWWERDQRHTLNGNVTMTLPAGERRARCELLDLSKGGCFISHRGRYSVGDIVFLKFKLDSIEFRVQAQVMWLHLSQKPRGVGLMFLNLKDKDHKVIALAIKRLKEESQKPSLVRFKRIIA